MTRSVLRSSTAALALLLAAPAAAQDDLDAACDIPTLSAGDPDAGLLQRCLDAGLLTAGDVELLQAQDLPDEAAEEPAAPQDEAPQDEAVVEDAEAPEAEPAVEEAPVEEAPVEEAPVEEEEPEAVEEVVEEAQDGTEEAETPTEPEAVDEAEGDATAEVEAPEAPTEAGGADAAAAEPEPDEELEAPTADDLEDALEEADQAGAAAEPAAEPAAEEVEPEEVTTETLGEALDEAVDQDVEAEAVQEAPEAGEPAEEGLGARTGPAAAEERAEGEAPAQDAAEAEAGPATSEAAAQEAAAIEEIAEDPPAEDERAEEPQADAEEPAAEETAAEETATEELDALGEALEGAAAGADGEMEVSQEDTEASAARANEAPTAAAAAEAGEAEAPQATEETLTEEQTRSSDEEFAAGEDEEGLSSFERALLLGLGAVAVGSVLSDGGEVVENTGDRVVIRREGELQVLKNDDELLRRPGSTVSQRRYDDGSTLTVVEREDGTLVRTIRAPNGQVLRRTRTLADGTEVVLFDDTRSVEPVDVAQLEELRARSFRDREVDDLAAALGGAQAAELGRSFSLQQIREIRAVRELMPQIDVAAVEFDTGSAVIRPTEAEALRDIGVAMAELVETNPDEVFLIEGHTDAVGSAASNLALSDRRAESVALALTEYFGVPPESMVAQGYGEANLKVQTAEATRENRRATVRRITPLLQEASAQ